MRQPQTQPAAAALDTHPLAHRQRVKVAVPRENVLLRKRPRKLRRRRPPLPQRDRRHPSSHISPLCQTINADPRHAQQTLDQPLGQHPLIRADHLPGRLQLAPPALRRPCRAVLDPKTGQIVDSRRHPSHPFMILRARLPLVRRPVSGRTHPVCLQPLQLFPLTVELPAVRAEKLVRRTRQEIASQGLHVDQPVRRILDRVHKRKRPRLPGPAHDRAHVVDGSCRVAGIPHRHQLRLRRNLPPHILHIQRPALHVHIRPPDARPPLLRRQRPRHHVRVMIQARNQHLVAWPQLSRQGPADMECEARHVVAKDDLVRLAAQQISDRSMRPLDHRVRAPAGLKLAVRIRIAARQIVNHRLNHALVRLRAAGVVKKHGRTAVKLLTQRRELPPDLFYIEHVSLRGSLPALRQPIGQQPHTLPPQH